MLENSKIGGSVKVIKNLGKIKTKEYIVRKNCKHKRVVISITKIFELLGCPKEFEALIVEDNGEKYIVLKPVK